MSDKALSFSSKRCPGSTEMLAMMHPWGIRLPATNATRTYAEGAAPATQVISLYPMPVVPQREATMSKVGFTRKRSSEESPTPPPVAPSIQQAQGCSSIPSKRPERMKDWLMRQIESKEHPGLEWIDKDAGIFCIPWRHAKHRDYDPNTDASIFRAWAVQSKRYHGEGDQASWKANFRSAICSLPDVQELPDKRTDRYRVFQIISETKKPRDHYPPAKRTHLDEPSEVVPLLSSPPSLINGTMAGHVPGVPIVLFTKNRVLPPSPIMEVRSPSFDTVSPRSITPVHVPCIRDNVKPSSVSSLSSLDKLTRETNASGLSHSSKSAEGSTPTHTPSLTPSHTPSLTPSCSPSHTPSHAYSDTDVVVDESQHEAKSIEEGQEESEHCDIGDGDVDDISDSDACHSSHGSDGYDVSLEESDGPFISAPEPPSEQGIHKPKTELSTDEPTDPPAESVSVKSSHSPQFHIAVYYNNLDPVVLETVKNKHGCYVYSGSEVEKKPFVHDQSHCVCLPSRQHSPSGNGFILNQLARGLLIESSEEGNLYVTSHTPLVVYVRSVYSHKGVSIKRLALGRKEKVFDYPAFKDLLLSLADETPEQVQGKCGEVPSPYVIMTLGQPMQKEHPLVMNYVTVVVYLRRVIRKMEMVYKTSLPPSDSFNCISLTTPPIELHTSEYSKYMSIE